MLGSPPIGPSHFSGFGPPTRPKTVSSQNGQNRSIQKRFHAKAVSINFMLFDFPVRVPTLSGHPRQFFGRMCVWLGLSLDEYVFECVLR